MARIGIADTTFARYDMGRCAEETMKAADASVEIVRYTVPGIKDLPVACKILLEDERCDLVVAVGMPGSKPIDKQCAHEASMGIQQVQLLTNKHVLEVFVHEDEGTDDAKLEKIFKDRVVKHALNAIALLKGKDALTKNAGKGKRQGYEDIGQLQAGKQPVIAIVVSLFNHEITGQMRKHAESQILNDQCVVGPVIEVPGAFDMPLAVQRLLEQRQVDGVVTLGAIIQGDTDHDGVIAYTLAAKLSELSLRYNKPVALGVTGPKITYEQAVKRIQEYATRAVDTVVSMLKVLP